MLNRAFAYQGNAMALPVHAQIPVDEPPPPAASPNNRRTDAADYRRVNLAVRRKGCCRTLANDHPDRSEIVPDQSQETRAPQAPDSR
jgi:hypothetical protein